MKFGLDENIIEKVIQVFEANSKVDKALVYGSRAKGNYRPDSDIDIAVKGYDLTLDDIIKMSVAFKEKCIINKIDLIDYNSVQEKALVEHIDRVGIEFYNRWKEYKLGELTAMITKGTTPSTLGGGFVKSGINFIKSEAVSYDGRIDKSTFVCIDELTHKKLKRSQLEKDDILFSMAGIYLGKNALVPEDVLPANTNQALAIIRLNKNKTNPEFIHYYLMQRSVIEYVNNMSGQSAQPNINFEEIKSIDIFLPPKEEQSAIVSILNSFNDKIDLLHRQNKTLEQLAETLFRQWFVEEAEDSWEEKKLGELLTITSSKRIYYSEYVSSGIPFYRSKEIIELRNSGSTDSELYISNDRFNEINNKFGSPSEGDILMTSVGTLGVAYRVKKSDKFYFKDGNLTWFKDFKKLPSSIVYLWLISKIGQEELAAITIGSTQEALTIEGLKGISFKIPPKSKINEYEIEFNAIINKIDFNQAQIYTLTKLRNSILPMLMKGELRIKTLKK